MMGPYSVIYADPPWHFNVYNIETTARPIPYPTLDTAELCKLPVESITADDCVLFLWATFPNLLEAIQVGHA